MALKTFKPATPGLRQLVIVDRSELYKGKPRWTKDNCTHCTACINGCPQKALQYGKGTIKRTRYINNILNDTEVNND